ncbi:MJ0042-type zinc finger domain-containing protein [Archangium violaceum]|uniref:MJ0042-type zinc finger domain-containing protein n=1 Tax=Archangium violaceum TaxID=83451 RepID=UPI0036D882B1
MPEPSYTTCPKCSQLLRIPAEQVPAQGRTIEIRCSPCGSWFYWTVPASTEIRQLNFRCVHDGKEFSVVYAKDSNDQRFRIREIQRTANLIEELYEAAFAMAAVHAPGTIKNTVWNAGELEHSGWRCPYCGDRGLSTSQFFRCNACKELVCQARVIQIRGGGQTFTCHPGCGSSGELVGTITSYDGKVFDVTTSKSGKMPQDVGDDRKKLPDSRSQLAKKRER